MTPEMQKIRRYRLDPIHMVQQEFNTDPDQWQREVLEAFADQNIRKMRISLQACVGPGKSAVLAWCGWNFLLCYGERGEHPKGACVAITQENLRDNLWAEYSKWQQRSKLLQGTFTWTASKIFANDHKETWFLAARSFPRSADPDTLGKTLSGIHSKYVLFQMDESGAIPPQVGRAAEQALVNVNTFGRIMQAGNPLTSDGMLYTASISDKWKVVRITGDPKDPRRSPRIDIEWAQEQIDEYGRDNPWVMAHILGQFPPSGINTLLGPDEIRDSMARHYREEEFSHAQKRLGVDTARFGDDRTVIFPRQGLVAFNPVTIRDARTEVIAARVLAAKKTWGSEVEYIDGTGGYGAGTVDALIVAGHTPNEIHFSGRAIKHKEYYNKRAEMWYEMAKWVKERGCLPNNDTLLKELAAPTYSFVKGRFLLEPKEHIKKRLGFSPDLADALCLTFAHPELPKDNRWAKGYAGQNYKAEKEWDPLDDSKF